MNSDLHSQPLSLSWEDCTTSYYVEASVARGGGGYWPCMVSVEFDPGMGMITADDCRTLAAMLMRAADACDDATQEERDGA